MWDFLADWWAWGIGLSLIATSLILYFMPPSISLTQLSDDDNETTINQPASPLDETVPSNVSSDDEWDDANSILRREPPQRPDDIVGSSKATGKPISRIQLERDWAEAFASDRPPPLPLWRKKQISESSTRIVRWIEEEIMTAPDDASIVFKLYAEAAEVHSVLVAGTMITAVEIYAQFLKAAADWEKRHGNVVHTFSAEVIWGGETRGWLNFTL